MIRVIAEYLRVSKHLSSLSLNYCSIGNEVMNAIGKGLQNNNNLEVLSLKHNHITEAGMAELINALSDNRYIKLKQIDLSSNKISD